MRMIDLNRPSDDGKQYYEFAIVATGEKDLTKIKPNDEYEIIRFTNFGCNACIEDYIRDNYPMLNNHYFWRTFKTFFNGTKPELDLNNVPKKYQKLFMEAK